jgi:hypothetical protein
MEHKKEEDSSATAPDLELVDATIAFMHAARKHLDTSRPIAGAGLHPNGDLMDYAVGLAHAVMDALGGNGPVRDIARSTGAPENVRLESSLQELIRRRAAYIREH